MDLREFFKTVVSHQNGLSDSEAWFNLSYAPPKGQGWYEEWFKWPNDLEKVMDVALTRAEDSNVYFSSYLFSQPNSHKINVLGSRTIQADLDNADILTLPITPSVLVETSPGRHQGFWLLDRELDPEVHEVLSRKLTYAIKDADTSGWPLGRKVRVPWTFNYKYLEGPQEVKIVSAPLKVYVEEEIELLEDPPPFLLTEEHTFFLDKLSDDGIRVGDSIGPQELFASIKNKLPPSIQTQYNIRQADRSKALFALMCSLFRAGMGREEVWHLAWNSANNKFAELRRHGERELAKDVLRAEVAVKAKVVDERTAILEARKSQHLSLYERRQHIFDMVLGFLRDSGEFVHTNDDQTWYVKHDIGRPISLGRGSEWFNAILDMQFGLNQSEADTEYVRYGISNFCRLLPINGMQQSLSYYDPLAKHLLIHTGRKDVLRITALNVDRAKDGSYGVIFPWSINNELFLPKVNDPDEQWAEHSFENALNNVIGMEPNEALTLLRVWLLFLLFRSAAVSRPILAAFGQPGAGKSTLFRRIYRLLYGRQKSVLKITSPENFDIALSSVPFFVADNVDSPERWLPDRLALAASSSDISKRKLYTDSDEFIVHCQAMVGISAHNPKFTREDVSDRLLLLTFKRLEKFIPEDDLLEGITVNRNRLWGGIVRDCQRVLATPQPPYAEIPQFRVEDFAKIGYWIAKALGLADEFTTALQAVSGGTKALNLNEDSILVDAIVALIKDNAKRGLEDTWLSPGQLWTKLQLVAPDAKGFIKLYKGQVSLGKKLLVLEPSLKEVFTVEMQFDKVKRDRLWRFKTKG